MGADVVLGGEKASDVPDVDSLACGVFRTLAGAGDQLLESRRFALGCEALEEEARHTSTVGSDRSTRNRGSPTVRRVSGSPSKLGARAHAELPVDARERHLDRLHAQEERRRDRLVRAAFGDELCDAPLAVGQSVGILCAATGDAGELSPSLSGKKRRADLLEEIACAREVCPRFCQPSRPTLRSTEVVERASVFERTGCGFREG